MSRSPSLLLAWVLVDVAALQARGVDRTSMAFVHLVLDVLRLDSASPPALLPRGEWWPLVVGSSAPMAMWHPERAIAKEMREVQLKLVDAVRRSTFGGAARPTSPILLRCRGRCSASGRWSLRKGGPLTTSP